MLIFSFNARKHGCKEENISNHIQWSVKRLNNYNKFTCWLCIIAIITLSTNILAEGHTIIILKTFSPLNLIMCLKSHISHLTSRSKNTV